MFTEYKNKTCIQFVEDMKKLGLEVQNYRGRFHWEGPAVVVDHFEVIDELRAMTTVKLQFDQMGLGYIVYPLESERQW